MAEPTQLAEQQCPMCGKETLTLTEAEHEINYFGTCYLFSMRCDSCKFYKSDIEVEQGEGPVKFTLKVEDEDDLNIRVIKSAEATIKIPRLATVEPGEQSNGYISNVEGVLKRIKRHVEHLRDTSKGDKRKKLKRRVKKLQNVLWGRDSLKLIIEDPSGNSAIVSEKATQKK